LMASTMLPLWSQTFDGMLLEGDVIELLLRR
jgi:hypothetical protein